MNTALLHIYHRLPPQTRTIAASLRGLYLRSWRYGPGSEALVDAALQREHWSAERWTVWRNERLEYVLHRAATRVPFYRDQWAERRRHGDRRSWGYLEHWPILGKEPLRANPLAFVADDCRPQRMFHEHTSGTSGTPLNLWLSRATVRAWYALFEARIRRWNGVSRHDRWAILGGQLVTPVGQRTPPFWVWNRGLLQLYMSSYHLAPGAVATYLDALRAYRIRYVLGYASSMYALAHAALELGLDAPRLEVAISNAEPLFEHQRQAIRQAFGCPVRDTYGMSEIVAAGSECEAGSLHTWPEAGLIEVLDEGSETALPVGSPGRLICTGLLNADMPLIRYEVGDRGALAPADQRCRCGRSLPMLAALEGRLDDVVRTVDGRRIGRLDPIFKADLPIREAQIVQDRLDHLSIRFVPASGYADRHGADMIQRLRERVGPVAVDLEPTTEIPRGANGKFRAVVSTVQTERDHRISTIARERGMAGD